MKPVDHRSAALGSDLPVRRVTSEMVIRHLMAEIDKVDTVVVGITYKGEQAPMVLHSDNVSDYFLSFVGSILLRLATRMMDGRR